jgi:cyanophycinase
MSQWAFLGAGEFQPWHHDMDAHVLAGRTGSVVVLATASAAEGSSVYQDWQDQGRQHYAAQGWTVATPDLRVRADAFDASVVASLDDAALVFFSGGNPAYLAGVVTDTPFWSALRQRLDAGMAYVGCSAGVACLSDPTFDSAAVDESSVWAPGIGHFPGTLFAPHWDTIDHWRPNARDFIVSSVPEQGQLVALDEYTAMVGDGHRWTVFGGGGVHCYRSEQEWTHHDAGTSFVLPLRPVGSSGSE